jgi:hypothetical protein
MPSVLAAALRESGRRGRGSACVTTQPRPCVAFVLAGSAARDFQRSLRRRGTAECGFDSFEPAVELTELLRGRRLGVRGRLLTP